MAIATLADYRASLRQQIMLTKAQVHNPGGRAWSSMWDATGVPGAGTLSPGNTANGVVLTAASTGAPSLGSFTGVGYITAVEATIINNSTPGRFLLYDRLYAAGEFAFNVSGATLSSQPSFSSRLPNGAYEGTQLWMELSSSAGFNGAVPTLTVTYTNQAGTSGRSTTATFAAASALAGPLVQVPLAAGDTGIQKIESVTMTGPATGGFTLLIIRPLVQIRCDALSVPYQQWLDRTGMPRIWNDSCLAIMQNADTGTGMNVELRVEVASA